MLSGSCQATNHIKPHLPAHRPQPMGCFCLPVYLKTNQLQRHNAKNRRPLHIAWPALSDAMIIKAVIMRLMYYYIRLFTESSISRYVSVMWPLVLQWYCRCFSVCSPVDSWLWDLRRVVGVLELEERVEPALLALEMGSSTGVTGGESSYVRKRFICKCWPAFVAPYEKFYFFPNFFLFSFSLHKLTFY